jgi:hypothetical protein
VAAATTVASSSIRLPPPGSFSLPCYLRVYESLRPPPPPAPAIGTKGRRAVMMMMTRILQAWQRQANRRIMLRSLLKTWRGWAGERTRARRAVLARAWWRWQRVTAAARCLQRALLLAWADPQALPLSTATAIAAASPGVLVKAVLWGMWRSLVLRRGRVRAVMRRRGEVIAKGAVGGAWGGWKAHMMSERVKRRAARRALVEWRRVAARRWVLRLGSLLKRRDRHRVVRHMVR